MFLGIWFPFFPFLNQESLGGFFQPTITGIILLAVALRVKSKNGKKLQGGATYKLVLSKFKKREIKLRTSAF